MIALMCRKGEGTMKKIILGSTKLEKWLHQNDAEYTGDFVDGVLLDNFVVMTKRGFAAVYEKYLNSNSSCYEIHFETGTAQNMFNEWYEFESAMEKQAQELEEQYKRLQKMYVDSSNT